ncbi:carbonic anhydrase-like [Ciona intestinalis]
MNSFKTPAVLLLLSTFIIGFSNAATWSYGGSDGPGAWGTSFPDCAKTSQSPIKIVHAQTTADPTLGSFSTSMFTTTPTAMELTNNGHALQVNLVGGYTISDTKVLPGNYQALQFHLHWAANGSTAGSEHWLDGVQYFGELHIVHMNTKYANISVALANSDGLAVLGFFVKIEGTTDNANFDVILNPVRNGNVTYDNDVMPYATPFPISQMFPTTFNDYYRYPGSLTTPPCAESVVWTMFRDPIVISQAQAQVLQTSLYANEETAATNVLIGGNYRPTLDLNGRVVKRTGSGAGTMGKISIREMAVLVSLICSAIFW